MPVNILFIGDIVGSPGRQALVRELHRLVDHHRVDLVVANGENSAGGFGITEETAKELFSLGIDVLTSGNHIWDKRESFSFIGREERLVRPANYPPGTVGRGSTVVRTAGGVPVGILNLEGRVFMNNLDCPFRAADQEIERLRESTPLIFVDFHAEATSEKIALGWYLDGKASAVVGTHTHVQTADERILPGGTAYITDAGMTGSFDSVIGVRKELAVERFVTQMPVRFEVAKKDVRLNGVVIGVDPASGRALSIERISLICS
ncbi:TIGR00282 family metallophosphoesterase [Geobacter sulfurreducens]|jgi:metallophosphoesterase (TIGR00282 family)|uniref:2',3'-cyclic nucleotide 2'-phosphodiesterase n=1 Tax=Geobacter sulfurreducens (strain ATCC 51573 / DSM 12127 / PCA) TaxID=243231 RepID=Q74E26_GEOSL|nr:TIGR00282 family metallophosphoesterase [Geobacter sulfurreducens]AAR34514.1 2',3'-cyclic nucleotide 2'-phosphodiesterase [Geobacter sulfurreducens PCA]ADI83974.1 2',3'-cyclic nucleotide 2'-phosphodiesterase [Geobacter sulfurreducens KN400]AJY70859.1 metallophosphoesterase [Geobacter sulfurreducens]QVW36363.1 TIGR00282 family metallophosphoesterase [Geobacter sulfurreducens]UAC05178.1 TIGR00282 family metallophosphoesterase [Geobacter sulfurreducens]